MVVCLNGEFVPEERALVSVFDRGFLYGDGLFETLRIFVGNPFRWRQHIQRLWKGAKFLGIALPHSEDALRRFSAELVQRNALPDCVLRITLSRGVGSRGYSPQCAEKPTLAMSLHPVPLPDPTPPRLVKLITSSVTVRAGDPLAAFKTANKLVQILARAEADRAGVDEALLLDIEGHVVEATASNVFWIDRESVCTPPVSSGALPGVTRAAVLELCGKLGVGTKEASIALKSMQRADGVFLTNSVSGIVEVTSLDSAPACRSPIVESLRSAYTELVRAETGRGNS
jgi:branched-chain amino acid aminotransferase